MSHYKKFSEHRHARDIAKRRIGGYDEGGAVRRFPVSGTQYDLNRLRSAQGVESGRISGIPGRSSNVVYGPGLNARGDVKQSWIRRVRNEDLPHAQGGVVRPSIGGMIPGVPGNGKRFTGGAESGVGRMELAKRAAKRK